MKRPEHIQLLLQTAIMYYRKEMTQQQIAVKLGLTRQTVSKLLKESEQSGIVDIRINNPLKDIDDMAEIFKIRFGLQNAVVIPSEFEDDDLIRSIITKRAAEYIQNILADGEYKNIAFSWGGTIYETIFQLENIQTDGVTVFPLVGAGNKAAPYYMINEMVRIAADRLCAIPLYAYIPAHPESSEDAELFKKTSAYRNMRELWNGMDVVVTSVGISMPEEKSERQMYPGENTKTGVAGDICTHYFDFDGNFMENDSIICASVESIRNAKRIIAVCGGLNKVKAIYGALRTGLITDFITDELTAAEVLKRD